MDINVLQGNEFLNEFPAVLVNYWNNNDHHLEGMIAHIILQDNRAEVVHLKDVPNAHIKTQLMNAIRQRCEMLRAKAIVLTSEVWLTKIKTDGTKMPRQNDPTEDVTSYMDRLKHMSSREEALFVMIETKYGAKNWQYPIITNSEGVRNLGAPQVFEVSHDDSYGKMTNFISEWEDVPEDDKDDEPNELTSIAQSLQQINQSKKHAERVDDNDPARYTVSHPDVGARVQLLIDTNGCGKESRGYIIAAHVNSKKSRYRVKWTDGTEGYFNKRDLKFV